MAITFPLTLPAAPAMRRIRWSNLHAAAEKRSPFSLKRQVHRWTGQLWAGSVELPPMTRANAEAWIAFLLALDGPFGTFELADPDGAVPRGAGGGAPQVNGAAQTGQVLNTKGWPVSTTVLLTGDQIELGAAAIRRLHKTLTDTVSDGAGLATLDIWPRLREVPADSQPLAITGCAGTFALAGNVSTWDVDATAHYGLSFNFVEAI